MGTHRGRYNVQLGQKARRERDPGLAEEQQGEREGQCRLATTEAAIGIEVVLEVSPAADNRDHREAPEDQKRVHEDVIDASGDPLGGCGRQADEDEPGMVDRGVREHPLHIVLDEASDRTEEKRDDGNHPQQRLPIGAKRAEGGEEDS